MENKCSRFLGTSKICFLLVVMASERWILDLQSPDKRLKREDSAVRGRAGSRCSLKFESPDESLKREDSTELRVCRPFFF